MHMLALFAIIALACLGLWVLGRLTVASDTSMLVELFRASHELSWPIGVQEDDLPPAFGSRIRPPSAADIPEDADEGSTTAIMPAGGPAAFVGEAQGRMSWREPVRAGPVRSGSAAR